MVKWPSLRQLAVLGLALGTAFFDLAPAFAQAPPPVPALPDTERRTAYSLTAQTGPFSVGFALFGDSTDYANWLTVSLCTSAVLNPCSQLTAVTDWTLASATGPLATIPRPITDATITLTTARTGTLQIVGARRPRRTAQFAENRGVAARDLNQVLTDNVAKAREDWDLQQRTLRAQPGELISPLQPATTRAGGILCWDATGLIPNTCAAGSSGTANVVGPNVSVVGHIATFGNTLGTILLDGGLVGAGDFVGPAGAAVDHVMTFASTTGKVGKDSGLTLTPSTGTITLTNAKTLAVTNTLTLSGTDSTVMTFPTTSATLARTDAANTFTGHQTIEGVTSTGATGTGNLVFATAPTLGVTTVTSLNKVTVTAPATGSTLTIADGKTLTDTSGVGASVLLGAAGGGFSAYAGGSCTNQFIRSLSAAAAPTCASVANTDLTNSSITIGSTNVALGATAATVAGLTLTAPTINGGTHTALTALGIRSTGTGAFDLTLANTENLTAGRTLTVTVNNAPRTVSLSGNITAAADFTTNGANALTLTTTGTTNVTLPTSGTLATRDTVNTFSATNTFSAVQQFTDIKFSSGKLYPTSDSTTALQVTKADGTTRIMNFDTTNARVGINKNAGAFDLDVNGAVNVGGTLTFTTLDAASLGASPTTITGLTINNSPSSSNDYLLYYNAAAGAIRRCTVGSCAAAATAGVSSLNGLTGGLSIVAGNGLAVSAVGSSVTVGMLSTTITPQHRITLASATPVMTASQAAKTTVFVTPYSGNLMPIYDGTNFIPTSFAETSQLTTDATKSPAAVAASSVYDIFCWVDTGPTNRCTRGPAWTNTTTRSAGTALVMVNGINLNNASITNGPVAQRGTYVGSICSDGSSQINYVFGAAASGGTAANFCVWNAYNRVSTGTVVTDSGANYTYTSSTPRQARASAGNQISFLLGLAEDTAQFSYTSSYSLLAGTAIRTRGGVGFDTTSAFSRPQFYVRNNNVSVAAESGGSAAGQWAASIGVHILSANESNPDNTSANTFNLDANAALEATIRN